MSHAVPEPRDLADAGHDAASVRLMDSPNRAHPRGQVLIIFAFLLTILLGMAAFVVDLAWIWSNQLQVQRAADAGALAGVVHLPADASGGIAAARAEAQKNGYVHNVDAQIVANPDPSFSRRMIVTISAPVDTFFMGLFGFDEVTVTRTARAEYILPVPMGSPQNYLGVGRLVVPGPIQSDSLRTADDEGSPSSWSNDDHETVEDSDNDRTSENSNDSAAWREFDISVPNNANVRGIEVQIEARKQGTGNCRVGVEISPDAHQNANWTATGFTAPASANLTSSDTVYTVGGSTEQWGRDWTDDDVEDDNFGVRLRRSNVSGSCTVEVDRIRIRVHYSFNQVTAVRSPYSTAITPQNFWAGMQSQGAPSVQGDAFMTKYTDRSPVILNPDYCPWPGQCSSNPEGLYNYAIELPAGGEVWLYDPGFCDGTGTAGTGEYWTIGGSNGADDPQPVSAFYRLYNTNNTAWDFTDDTRADGQAGTAVPGDPTDSQPNSFRRGVNNNAVRYYDSALRGEPDDDVTFADCSTASWHHNWWRLASGLPAGIYRLHTMSHDRILPNDQNDTTALNSFAIWASAGGTNINDVRVYGLGAMEAYFPLPPNTVAQFYLAQIEGVHANKWVDISLWDPGDARVLADLSILMPTSGGYVPVNFYSHSDPGTSLPSDFTCGPDDNDGGTQPRSSIRTSDGGNTGNFNGEWLRLCFQLPSDWSAPEPPPDALTPAGCECNGWFRIQYDMGNGDGTSTDLTTWKVEVRGNPVHLITPGDDVPTP